MRHEIELDAICNWKFAVTLNGHDFYFAFRTFRSLLFVSVTIDGTHEVNGVRAVPYGWILPPYAAQMVGGNFRFETDGDEYPHYTLFDGHSCRFVFDTDAEA